MVALARAWRTIWRRLARLLHCAPLLLLTSFAVLVVASVAEELLVDTGLFGLDARILTAIESLHTTSYTAALDRLALGLYAILVLPTVLVLLVPAFCYLYATHRPQAAVVLLTAPTVTMLLVDALQRLFQRHRPVTGRMRTNTSGYPSGHATLSVVIYGMLCAIFWRFLAVRRGARLALVSVAVGLMVVTGLSRIYLHVHFPSDVLVGWFSGGLLLAGVLRFCRSEVEAPLA